MNQTLEKLKDIEKNGYQLDFADVFNHAFENYKKIALYAGVVLVITVFAITFFSTASVVSYLGVTTMTQEFTPEKLKIENFSQETLFIIQGVILFFTCLFSPFQASFLKMADHGERDEAFPVSNLFYYYKLPYLIEIIVSTFLITAFNVVQSMVLKFAHLEILGIIISYFILFITFLTVPFIIFGHLKALDAIKYSVVIIMKQPFVILGLIITAIIGSFVGLAGCCVGIFFTLPFVYSMKYALYSAIIGINSPAKNE